MTDNQTEKTFDERLAEANAKIPVQTGRFRVATQVGPGTMSATILYDSENGNHRLQVFNHRQDAQACADEMNARTFKYDTDVASFALSRRLYADGHQRCEEVVEPINFGDEVGVRVTFSDGNKAVYATGCSTCAAERSRREDFFPPHTPSSYCESGSRPHCTCDRCF